MNSHFTKKLIAGAAVFCCAIGTASASIILTSNNTPYTQNFTGQTPGTLPGGWVTEVYHDGGSAGWRPTVENGSETPFNGGIRYFGADQVNSTALGFAAHSSWDALGDRDASFNW